MCTSDLAYTGHYQETPAETQDYTATQPIILAEQAVDGKPVKVLYHAPKNGFFFTIDRATGKLIDAKPFVDGINWATGYDLATGRPIENPEARFYRRSEEHTSELQSLMRISYAVFCLKKNKKQNR